MVINSTSNLVNPGLFEFVNSTLFVWNPDFSLFGINSTIITGNTTNDTSVSLSEFTTANNYNWNYLTCATNGTGQFCEFSTNNNTFNALATEVTVTLNNPADHFPYILT